MKISLALPLAMAGQLLVVPAFAQGSGRDVTILRMSGPQLGVRLVEVDKEAVTRLKLKEEKGALVTEVLKDSAAEKAGIKEDDVIVRFQGESVLTAAQLSRLVKDVPSGRKVDLDLIRGGAPIKVTATLENGDWSSRDGEMPRMEELNKRLNDRLGELRWKSEDGHERRMAPGPNGLNFLLDKDGPGPMALLGSGRGRLGVSYTEIEGQLAKYFKAPKESAVLVESVVDDSPAAKAGIKAGDLLIKVGGAAIEDGSDLMDAVSDLEGGKAETVTVWRDGKSLDLSVTVDEKPRVRTMKRRRGPVAEPPASPRP